MKKKVAKTVANTNVKGHVSKEIKVKTAETVEKPAVEAANEEATAPNVEPQYISGQAVVKMEVSAWFNNRVTAFAEFLLLKNCSVDGTTLDSELVNAAHAQISSGNITDDWVKHYETILILIYEFEKLAKEAGFVSDDPNA